MRALLRSASLLLALGPGILAAQPDAPAWERLGEAVRAGVVSPLEAARLHVLAVRAPASLPPTWAELAADAPRCITGALRDVTLGMDRLTPAQRDELAPLVAPPDADGPYLQSATFPLRVHYEDASQYAVALESLSILERSWAIEVGEMGWRAPLPDGGYGGSDDLDVFILPGSGGAAAAGLQPNPRTPWNDWSTYITLDPLDYGGDLLAVTLAHEFNHTCQAAYDWFETIVALESTAVWVEDRVYDDDNDYYTYLYYFQDLPHQPIDYLGGTWAWYVYAAGLWEHILAERWGDDVVLDMWENLRQRGYRNEPDFLDGVEIALQDAGGVSYAQASREIARWRYFIGSRDDGAHLEEAAALGDENAVRLEGAYTSRTLPQGVIRLSHPPAETAANLFEITVSPGDEAKSVAISFTGDDRVGWAVDVLTVPVAGGPATEIPHDATGGVYEGRQPLAGLSRVVVVVVNLGDGVHDPEDREWSGDDYQLSLTLTAARGAAKDAR